MKQHTVVITGLGVCSPIGLDLRTFEEALRQGRSGIAHQPELAELNFRCTVAGVPLFGAAQREQLFSPLERKRLSARGVQFGIWAALQAWQHAGLSLPANDEAPPHYSRGVLFGTGLSAVHTLREAIYKTDAGQVRRLGSAVVEQTMPSGISAYLGGKLGLGNWVSSNASACSTGTEALIMAARHIASGGADIMLTGSCDADGPHVWGGFDAMRVLSSSFNDEPTRASRPMASDAEGFVPGSGAGALVLESLESAQKRGATIYAEVAGGFLNSGGQRGNGSMTAPHSEGARRCILGALKQAEVQPAEIDLISGHLTSTMGDVREIENWSAALQLSGRDFPKVNAPKSLMGHCLSAAGALECVAAVQQLHGNFVHPSLNCENIHPSIAEIIHEDCVMRRSEQVPLHTVAKCSFGFGDVNAVVIFKKWKT